MALNNKLLVGLILIGLIGISSVGNLTTASFQEERIKAKPYCHFDYNNNEEVDILLKQFRNETDKSLVRKDYAQRLIKIREAHIC